jgi:hypothetical protein
LLGDAEDVAATTWLQSAFGASTGCVALN